MGTEPKILGIPFITKIYSKYLENTKNVFLVSNLQLVCKFEGDKVMPLRHYVFLRMTHHKT